MFQDYHEETRYDTVQGKMLPALSMGMVQYCNSFAHEEETAYLYAAQQAAKQYVLLSDE